MARSNFKWYGAKVKRKVKAGMGKNIRLAAEALASDIRRKFPASGQAGTRSGGGDVRNASFAGGIPNVQTAHLKRNIGVDMKGKTTARVGTGIGSKQSVGYALWLEFGAPTINLLPRPFLRPGLKRNKRKIMQIMGRDVI